MNNLEEIYKTAFNDELQKTALMPISKLVKQYAKSGNSGKMQRLGNILNIKGAKSLKKADVLEQAGKDPLSHLLRGTSRKVRSKDIWAKARGMRKMELSGG